MHRDGQLPAGDPYGLRHECRLCLHPGVRFAPQRGNQHRHGHGLRHLRQHQPLLLPRGCDRDREAGHRLPARPSRGLRQLDRAARHRHGDGHGQLRYECHGDLRGRQHGGSPLDQPRGLGLLHRRRSVDLQCRLHRGSGHGSAGHRQPAPGHRQRWRQRRAGPQHELSQRPAELDFGTGLPHLSRSGRRQPEHLRHPQCRSRWRRIGGRLDLL